MNNLLKNICLIIFALIGPITLPAGGIQRTLNQYKFPDNTEEISDKLFEISSNEILRNNLRIRGIENLNRFKNLNNFNETMDLIYEFSDK